MVRFIHAADIHLDSPLVGLSRYEGAPVEALRTATRSAFSALVDLAIAESVDFMVIAGDLYDGNWRDYNTGLFFCKEMGRLAAAGIPAYVLFGNHDAQSEITKQLPLPANVYCFSARAPQTFRMESLRVALHGQSFKTAATLDNLAAGYPDVVPGWLNIGVLHTALEGHASHSPYAPCAIPELVAKGYDYWALGHVHEYGVRHERPWVVYSGNLQGRHARETGARGAVLVTADDHAISVERRFVDVLRWHHLEVDASGTTQLDEVVDRIGAHLDTLVREASDGRSLAVRITVSGRCEAHGRLFGLEHQLRAEVLAHANAMAGDSLWIEKVCVETSPLLDANLLAARSDALADLSELLNAAAGDTALLQKIEEELRELVQRCPREVLESVQLLEAVRSGRLRDIVEQTAPSVLAQLATER